MPLDVELTRLTTGGIHEPNAEWTENARTYMLDAIAAINEEQDREMVVYKTDYDPETRNDDHIAIERLHSAVGRMISLHEFMGVTLPTKKDQWNWSLGESVQDLADVYDAEYALFIFVRDSYASTGRVFFQIAAAAVGVGVSGGEQRGFASLVDLRTGQVVWFNMLARGSGDLRSPEPARDTVELLLDDLPQ